MTPKEAAGACLAAFALASGLTLVIPVFAYEYPLSIESIREAYFIGSRRGAETSDFIARYTRRFPVPPKGPDIAEIRLETPFVQIVEQARGAPNYTAQDATGQFLGKPGVFRLLVKIYFTASYNALLGSKDGKAIIRTTDFWRDFKIRFVQDSEVHAEVVRGEPIYAAFKIIGAEVEVQYGLAGIRSRPAKIEVVAPDGTTVETTFDLSALR